MISDNEKDFKILGTFEDNKIFFYLSKDNANINQNIEGNQASPLSNKENANEKTSSNSGNEYVNCECNSLF